MGRATCGVLWCHAGAMIFLYASHMGGGGAYLLHDVRLCLLEVVDGAEEGPLKSGPVKVVAAAADEVQHLQEHLLPRALHDGSVRPMHRGARVEAGVSGRGGGA